MLYVIRMTYSILCGILVTMIKNYRDKRTENFARGNFERAFQGFSQQAEKRLEILNAAESTKDLAALPSNRFEALSGDRAGQFAIRKISNGGSVLNGQKMARNT